MNISEYDYIYPESAVALHPPEVRGESKLFVVDTQSGYLQADIYENLDKYVTAEDVLVRNVTKVFHARLFGRIVGIFGKDSDKIEIFITEPHAQSLEEYAKRQYDRQEKGFRLEFLTSKRKLKAEGLRYIDFGDGYRMKKVVATGESFTGIFYKQDGTITVEKLFKLFEDRGKVPLPPYIKRETLSTDDERYQTIFAQKLGSVAAPTASLNFTQTLENRLKDQGTAIAEITLHVGRGTFLPLRNDTIEMNVLHAEPFFVTKSTIEFLHHAKEGSKKIISMGTTTTRTLESIASQILSTEAKKDILSETQLFIYPPYEFRIVDGLLTNFHFPKSSLITLVDAFLGWKKSRLSWREIYEFAIKNDAKLFSYGDSMLII
ncbi:tRNA preQ1(34) S-adenosylmethionine ribosyltransferase-isomerase QueA [bacterium]|nr:tRNA preQ1(34) S-adenosylmethionine ribosyltransferase-isomerase QueA [bacterium]